MKKRALVTGASVGIGRAIAKTLASKGYSVHAVARNAEQLQSLVQEMGSESHAYTVADLTKPEDTARVAHLFKEERFTLLVNNAGSGHYGPFATEPLAEHLHILHLNCEALVVLSHAFLETAQKGDALVNISSVLAFLAMPTSSIYSATKAFVTSFSESLWFEQKKRGVYVMNLCPGLTRSEFSKRAGGRVLPSPPSAMIQSPEDVADLMMRALKERREPTVISGPKNRFVALSSKFLSRKSLVKMMGTVAHHRDKEL